MSSLQTDPSSRISQSALADPPAWGVFRRLFHELDARPKASDQIKEALETIQKATSANIACWYNETTGEIQTTACRHPLSAEACQTVVARLLAGRPARMRSILWHRPYAASDKRSNLPLTAAAVRLHHSRPGWIVALSSHRAPPLDGSAIRLMSLARAMLLKQWKHSWICAEVKESLLGLVRCLTAVIDAKDPCTAGHSDRVSQIAVRIGQQMNLPAETVRDLRLAGLLHDVGKIGIRDEVLLKPGQLTDDEREHLRTHVLIGDQILSTIKPFHRLRPGVRGHHEHYDGTGYPDGLAGEAIPLAGRILAVADACDAMMSPRRYRGALPPPHIDTVLRAHAGGQWDPNVVEAFMDCRDAIYSLIHQKGIGESAAFAIDQIVEALKDGSASVCLEGVLPAPCWARVS